MKLNIDHAVILSLLGAYTGKLLVLGAHPADAAVILILAVAHGFYNSQMQNKKVLELSQQVSQLLEDNKEFKKSVDDCKTAVSSIKLSQGMLRKSM